MSSQSRLPFSWSEIAAGAFAALSGAFTASTLGIYGTLTGAAVMSVITTAGTAISHHYLKKTRAGVARLLSGSVTPSGSGSSPSTQRWLKVAGATGLVVASVTATVASMTLVADTPMGKRLFAQDDGPDKTIVKKTVVKESDGAGSDSAPEAAPQGGAGQGGNAPDSGQPPPVTVTETPPPQQPDQQQDVPEPDQPQDDPTHSEPTNPPAQTEEPPATSEPDSPTQPSGDTQDKQLS